MALGDGEMLKGFKKEMYIALHFRKSLWGQLWGDCGFKTRDWIQGRKAHCEFLEK